MIKIFFAIALISVVTAHPAMAHIWRVNNDPAKAADFTTIVEAIAAAAAGDTIHVEPSATVYGAFVLNKRLVILGNGYFLGGGNLQVDKDSTLVNSITIDSSGAAANASGSLLSGLSIRTTFSLLHNVRNITITRCLLAGQLNFVNYTRASDGIDITQSFLQAAVTVSTISAPVTVRFENDIFSAAIGAGSSSINLDANFNGLFRNNTVNTSAAAISLSNFYIANNVFTGSALTTINAGNNIVRNNSFAAAAITGLIDGQDGNSLGIDMTPLFAGSLTAGYGDARFQTQGPGTLRASGETIGGITPDRGAYNTVAATDSYRTSGIPAIPTIYALTVPLTVPSTATSMDIHISTRSNN